MSYKQMRYKVYENLPLPTTTTEENQNLLEKPPALSAYNTWVLQSQISASFFSEAGS